MCGLSDLFPVPVGGSTRVLSAIVCKTHSLSHSLPTSSLAAGSFRPCPTSLVTCLVSIWQLPSVAAMGWQRQVCLEGVQEAGVLLRVCELQGALQSLGPCGRKASR